MTMASMAIGPANIEHPSMLGHKRRCHVQQGPAASGPPAPPPPKGNDTLSKGKKSWSIRLGLSRASQSTKQEVVRSLGRHQPNWEAMMGDGVLAQQMVYGVPWLYGTVRATGSRAFGPGHLPQLVHHCEAPVLFVCSCPDFLSGTVRNVGSNCRKCGGYRLEGLPIGGTCRIPTMHIRTRPSLAGILKPSIDDSYELMRQNKLLESRGRARSISPLQQTNQRDFRSQSVRCNGMKNRGLFKVSNVEPVSRTEWFQCCPSESNIGTHPGSFGLQDDNSSQLVESKEADWSAKNSLISKESSNLHSSFGRIASIANPANKSNGWQSLSWQAKQEDESSSAPSSISSDSRKSILESYVNPYLLFKNQQESNASNKDEDELSDDLSDNALENELKKLTSKARSGAFDSSVVKPIERIPNRSSVSFLGGQRVRIFNEPLEPSTKEDGFSTMQSSLTRIPIPKISPKRPPRRLKETKNVLKSILKRTNWSSFADLKPKSVMFKVDNIILAPEKPMDIFTSMQRRASKADSALIKDASFANDSEAVMDDSAVSEAPIIPEEIQVERPHRFITIPNIKSLKQPQTSLQITHNQCNQQLLEAQIIPKVKTVAPASNDHAEKMLQSRKQELQAQQPQQQKHVSQDLNGQQGNGKKSVATKRSGANVPGLKDDASIKTQVNATALSELQTGRPDNAPDHETSNTEGIAIGEDTVNECEEQAGDSKHRTCLMRSQSERSKVCRGITAANVGFVDTMRLSYCRCANAQGMESSRAPDTETESSFEATNKWVMFQHESTTQKSKVIKAIVKEEKENGELEIKVPDASIENREQMSSVVTTNYEEHFRNVRSSRWSPPPVKADTSKKSCQNLFKVCKTTVVPNVAPRSFTVHRLQVGSSAPLKDSCSTSIMIHNKQQTHSTERTLDSENKVTISVNGENSICNPTVIAINNNDIGTTSSIQTSSDQKRTLVFVDNYQSNIVINGESSKQEQLRDKKVNEQNIQTIHVEPVHVRSSAKFKESIQLSENPTKLKLPQIGPSVSSEISKEQLISNLVQDSLRIVHENCESLDNTNGQEIIKILKQSLLKTSHPMSASKPECVSSCNNLNLSPLNNKTMTNTFVEENVYEIIKEPIYEEIMDESSTLSLSLPPTKDYLKDRIVFKPEYKDRFRDINNKITQPEDTFYKPVSNNSGQNFESSYLHKRPDEHFKKIPNCSAVDRKILSSKYKLLNFIDSKERKRIRNLALGQKEEVDDEDEEEEEDEEIEDEEDSEQDFEALYEQKVTSLGDLSSKSSQISNVSYSSEENNIILANSPDTITRRIVDIERTDSGVGSESSQASSSSCRGDIGRRWRAEGANELGLNIYDNDESLGVKTVSAAVARNGAPYKSDGKQCEDCEQRLEPLNIDSGRIFSPVVCRKCRTKRAERKEIITEIVETEKKYGRDLQIILEEFHRPILKAGLLTMEQLSAIFLNVEELLEHNQIFAEKLKAVVDVAQESGDEELVTVDLGKIFLESERMLHAFESYCTRQGGASLLLQNLEKEKELLRIFLKVSQMENAVLRRMNLNSFLMVPVQRVTKYPLLLARLLKATPSRKTEMQELRKMLKQAQTDIELHLERMNAEAKDITSTKLWRRISIIQNGRRSTDEQDMINIKLRKMALEVLEWVHENSRFVLEGRLLVAQSTDNNWRRSRTIKLSPITAMLVTNGKPNSEFINYSNDCLFPRQTGIKDATLLLVKEKLGRYSLLREPLYLDKCIVCCEADFEDYFEVQELYSRETFIFKLEALPNKLNMSQQKTALEPNDGVELYRFTHNPLEPGDFVVALCRIS